MSFTNPATLAYSADPSTDLAILKAGQQQIGAKRTDIKVTRQGSVFIVLCVQFVFSVHLGSLCSKNVC